MFTFTCPNCQQKNSAKAYHPKIHCTYCNKYVRVPNSDKPKIVWIWVIKNWKLVSYKAYKADNDGDSNLVFVPKLHHPSKGTDHPYLEDWFKTRKEALHFARVTRAKKIKTLNRQLACLQKKQVH